MRPNRSGTIRQRGEHSWQVRVYNPITKKQDPYTVYGDRKDAEAFAASKTVALHAGTYRPRRQTLAEYMEPWLDRHPIRETTRPGYKGAYYRYLKGTIGHIELGNLTDELLEDLYAALIKQGLSPTTVTFTHRILMSALHSTRIRLYPKPPKARHYEAPALDLDQAKTVLSRYREFPVGPIVVFSLLTGLRRSELCGLLWDDLSNDEVTVRRGRHRYNGTEFINEPKSKQSRRKVSLPALAVDVLEELPRLGPYVFMRQPTGRWPERHLWEPDTVTRAATKMFTALDLDGFTLHSGGRHSAMTMLIASGVHSKIVMGRFGHSSEKMANRYTHVAPAHDKGVAEYIDRILGQTLGPIAAETV